MMECEYVRENGRIVHCGKRARKFMVYFPNDGDEALGVISLCKKHYPRYIRNMGRHLAAIIRYRN